jgi:hypothetical protein
VSRGGGRGGWGWLLAIVLGAGVVFAVTNQATVKKFWIATGEIVGSVEGAGGSP